MPKTIKVCLMGFGNVNQAFVHLITRKKALLEEQYDLQLLVSAIASARHGHAIDPDGIDLEKALKLYQSSSSLNSLSSSHAPKNVHDFIAQSGAEILVEATPVNYETGEPAISHIRAALEAGLHAVSANKGPVAHAYHDLRELANRQGRQFLFESTVMDGAPIFSLVRETLPAAEIRGFEGILNSCTNLIIERMEDGESFESAVEYAQSIGIAETEPSGDIDGWDAAIKVAALITVLMNEPFTPQQVAREGIRDLSATEVQQAMREGNRWKLVCRAERETGILTASVGPELVEAKSPLFSVNGTSSIIVFNTDVLPGLAIQESDPGPETTAYGLLADILNIVKAGG